MNQALATTNNTPASLIAEQNDSCRRSIIFGSAEPHIPCRIVKTSGVAELDEIVQLGIFRKVAEFDDFTADNDPYGEHDFGSVEHDGYKALWKFGYYDMSLTYGSEDPADVSKTMRVLTIMRLHEY